MESIVELKSKSDFDKFINKKELSVVHFAASWVSVCEQLNTILSELLLEFKDFTAAQIDAEGVSDVSYAHDITAAPTVLFFQAGKEIDRLNGFNPADLKQKIMKHTYVASLHSAVRGVTDPKPVDINDRCKSLINRDRLTLFMKGTPDSPQCGFSRQIVDLLNSVNAKYWSYDILSDDVVREGLKKYSNWPTYPQLYLDGELIGGLDVVREEMKDPDFLAKLPKSESLNDRLKKLVNQAPVMLFIKGSPDQPKCGFSRQIVQLLQDSDVMFSSFDILSDEEVRQGLKKYSNWPTYPQLYLHGELVGGLDVVREELKDPEFLEKMKQRS
ncbi:hypothetical protein AB6A40_001085 [Gnathostoma spinigerum]|uniref:Glutaredoxin n=1 Tax=Gnathostoma spinigerum TaxID=75299 RepID=A0ABD6E4M7_9BILA